MINRVSLHTFCERLKSSDLFKDSFWALAGSALGKGLSLLAGIAVARFLGKEVYGEYGTIRTTLFYIAIVSTFGFGYTATKFVADYISEKPEKLKSLVWTFLKITLVFSGLLALVQIIFAASIALFIDAPNLEFQLRFFSLLIILNGLQTTQIAILSGFKKFKETAKINIYTGFVVFIGSIIMTWFWGLTGALGALMLSFVVQVILNQIIIRHALTQYNSNEKVSRSEIYSMLGFSIPVALQESLYTIVHWIGLLLLIHFANYGEVGLSSAAALWQSVVIFVPAMLKNVMFSYLSSSDNHSSLINKLLLVNFLSSLLPVSIVILFSGFISSFYGVSFVGLPKVLNTSAAAALFICLSEVYCYEFISRGKPWIVFIARLVRDMFILILTYIILQQINESQAYWFALISLIANGIFLILLHLRYRYVK